MLDAGKRRFLADNVELRRGRGRPRKRPNKEIVRPLACVLSQTIAKKPRTITRMVRKEYATIDISESSEERTPSSDGRNLQESSPWNAINTPPSATMECRRGRGRPRKRPENEYHQPLRISNTHMGLSRKSVTLDISKSVDERTPYSNEEDTPESSDVGERIPPEGNVECRQGRGRPRKKPNDDSLRPLSCSLWEPITKKARTKTRTVLTKETVTIDLPKLVEERKPPLYALKTEELPHWSGTSVAQLPDVGEMDGLKAEEELPSCIDKEERKDKGRAKELNLPPLQPVPEEVPENSSRPWMWDTEIPGPIPPDIFELPWEIGLLSNFWCGVPVL